MVESYSYTFSNPRKRFISSFETLVEYSMTLPKNEKGKTPVASVWCQGFIVAVIDKDKFTYALDDGTGIVLLVTKASIGEFKHPNVGDYVFASGALRREPKFNNHIVLLCCVMDRLNHEDFNNYEAGWMLEVIDTNVKLGME